MHDTVFQVVTDPGKAERAVGRNLGQILSKPPGRAHRAPHAPAGALCHIGRVSKVAPDIRQGVRRGVADRRGKMLSFRCCLRRLPPQFLEAPFGFLSPLANLPPGTT
jgi:hypothetical protein